MLKVLMVASVFSICLDMLLASPEARGHAWIEGAAIMIAVFIVASVGSFVDWKKEVQFVKSRMKSNEKNVCVVTRNGQKSVIHHDHLHVGDIINVEYGMAVPVDGMVITAVQLSLDEAAMTGESDEMKKETMEVCLQRLREKESEGGAKATDAMLRTHELPSPLILSGTNIGGGEGQMMCLMVGKNSCLGQIRSKLEVRPETTPLQEKLERIATDIGKFGVYIALLIVHVLLFRYLLEGLSTRNTDLFGGESPDSDSDDLFVDSLAKWLNYVIVGVAIIVVAVPEGLPLAVMISLAYSIQRMLVDNNDVKRLSSCEIMGGANNICSDKTGTLTLNMMKVVKIWAGKELDEIPQTMDADGKMSKLKWSNYFGKEGHIIPMHIEHNVACNTSEKAGATDKAMTELIDRMDCDQKILQERHLPEHKIRFPFSSKRKRMSTVLENLETSNAYGKRLHIKGASEIVKNCCSHYLDEAGNVKELTDSVNKQLDDVIHGFAKEALRTICLAYKDLIPEECGVNHDNPKDADVKEIEKSGLTLICIFGIMDIVRPEVPGAVKQIQRAGVTVRMVTGDNIVTARAIAVKCNILNEEEMKDDRCCMEGPAFYEKMGGLQTDENGKECVGNFKVFKDAMPYMKVMARSRPEDKYLMATGLRQMGCTVAMTGDGTNDAPALKKADVGFAMGKTGTDTCKEAADILITDDNFYSIVKACKWGRNVFDNIKRFLQFQLTVNVGACIVTFVGAVIGKASPLQAIQLLWVNLIMDSLASLALATELPKESLLLRKP
jgi:Ca2+ transporting ATPase